MNERKTRRIVAASTAALWATIALTARVEVAPHWYAAILLATFLAGAAGLICMADALARARTTAGMTKGDAERICEAIEAQTQRLEALVDQHAKRVESATEAHGDRMKADVFDLRHWMANKYRGQKLAQIDAAMEAERRSGADTGPMPSISNWPR